MTVAVIACGGGAVDPGNCTGTGLCVLMLYGFQLGAAVGQSLSVTIGYGFEAG